ncbi:furin-like protease kpc-1 [Centruroides vittatus]|uniref:furin-like protease kpc-1 n=1 Tax=Centruroides vittatus TaxID=120091 RepID=UPI00350F04B8
MRKETSLCLILIICIRISYQLNKVTPSSNYGTNYENDSNLINSLLQLNDGEEDLENETGKTISKISYDKRFQHFDSINYKSKNEILSNDEPNETYTRYLVVKIKGGRKRAKSILRKHGYKHVIQVFRCDDYYLVENINRKSRFKRDEAIDFENDVLRIFPQYNFFRYRRDTSELPAFTESEYTSTNSDRGEMDFNDPYYKDQWYLHYYTWHHLNIQSVWRAGYTGHDIRISILDDGIHPDNPDLGRNYDPSISYDYVHFKDIDESTTEVNSHGTSCAGVVAALSNNNLCGVGIAYNARIGGCRVLDGPMTDAQEAMSIVHALDKVDIYSASWGPRDDGKRMAKPGILARRAFLKGVTEGRNGKGSIYVWAAGNGGKYHDNCNMDGYASNEYTIAIGALSHHGRTTYYTEVCPATFASTYVGGFHNKPTIETLLQMKAATKVIVPGDHGNCRKNFQGTSAAAPMAAGLIALLLEAKPELTWRDVQYIIVKSARIPNSKEDGWMMNAAGYHYHSKIGFGVMDCGRMISIAQNWNPVEVQKSLRVVKRNRRYIQGEFTTIMLTVDYENIREMKHIHFLEYVIATLSIRHPRRGNLRIYLISPSNTISQLLSERPRDHSRRGFKKWKFKTVHFWGENPSGDWMLKIQDLDPKYKNYNKFIDFFTLTLYGTSEKSKRKITRDSQFEKDELNNEMLHSILKKERILSRSIFIQEKYNSSTINKSHSPNFNSKCSD